jgi:hypothetical protein
VIVGQLEVSLVGSAAEDGGWSPSRPQLIRPVHVADLLSREGHPLAARVEAARETRAKDADEPRDFDAGALARRTLGVAAGAMLVVGTVAAGVLGLGNDGSGPGPSTASSGEPVGALPGKGSPGQPGIAPAVDGTTAPQFTNTAATESLPGDTMGPAGEIGAPVALKAPKVEPPRGDQAGTLPAPRKPAAQQPAPAPAPAQPAGPVQAVTEPVTNTVEQTPAVGQTLSEVVTPVTGTVDDTLQPALSLIGGLLSR